MNGTGRVQLAGARSTSDAIARIASMRPTASMASYTSVPIRMSHLSSLSKSPAYIPPERSLSRIRIRRPLRPVNLGETGALARIGADARRFTAAYAVSQRWSRAIQTHPEEPHGILYRPRHDPARLAAALFDRTAERVTAETLGTWLDQRAMPAEAPGTYAVALIS